MSTTPTAQQLEQQLASTGKQEHLYGVLKGIGSTVFICSAVVLLITLAEWALDGSIPLRTTLFFTAVGITALSVIAFVSKPVAQFIGLWKSDSIDTLATRVGRVYPDVSDMLCNVLQLQRNASDEMSDAAFNSVAGIAVQKDFSAIIDKSATQRAIYLGFGSLLTVAIFLGVVPQALSALERVLTYSTSYAPKAPFQLSLTASNQKPRRGETVVLTATAKGIPPATISIWVQEKGSATFTSFTLRKDSANTYAYQLPNIQTSAKVYCSSPWLDAFVETDTIQIEVIDKPLVRTLSGRVTPPVYTRQTATVLTETQADITTLTGSGVTVQIQSNKQLQSARLRIMRGTDSSSADTTVIAMKVNGNSATAQFVVSASAQYNIELTDTEGLVSDKTPSYQIVALSDAYPAITLMQPQSDVDIDRKAILPIEVSISDDYGFSGLKLHYRMISSRYAQPDKSYTAITIPLADGATSAQVPYVWNLSSVGITPEDVYEFYLEVSDNDIVRGPKTAKTGIIKVRLPSLNEIYTKADNVQNEVKKELQQLAKEAESVKKEAEQLQRDLQKQQAQSKNSESTYEEKKKAEELMKRQQQLEQKMEEVAKKLEDMTQQMQQNKAISEETLQKYQELQQLMQQVKSPEMERMQEQMRKAMENIPPEEMQRMMKEVKFNEEEFKKQIERTLNLLKRIQAEQKTDELQKRAEELARKQDELRQRTENSNLNNPQEREKIANEQKALQDEMKKLAQEAKELQDLMKEIGGQMPTDKMEQAQQDLNEQGAQEKMQQAEQNIEQGEKESASQKQKSASESMQRFAQQMKSMKRDMKRTSQKEAMKGMQKGVNDMLDLSKQQEQLRDQMKNMDPNSSQFPQAAKQQQRIQEAMQNAANSMMQMAQKSTSVTPEMAQDMGDALQSMKDAIQQMQNRNAPMSERAQSDAMSSLNSAAQRMSDALGQMMDGEGSGQSGEGQSPGKGKGQGQSPFERLQGLAESQQKINEGSQSMGQGKNGQNGQPSEQQRAEMGRLASQQGKALKAIQEMEKEREQVGGSKQPTGDLSKIAEDMKEVMTDMQSGHITAETKMRQDRILSRLLNASRSINDKDYEKTRESNSGQDQTRQSPINSAFDELQRSQQQLRAQNNQLKGGYTKDYENIIRLYMESLQKQRVQQR